MVEGETWKLMSRVSHCQYRMTLKAHSDRGDSEWSDVKYFGTSPKNRGAFFVKPRPSFFKCASFVEADKESNATLYAAINIPLLCASLVTLTCVCCRRWLKAPFFIFFCEDEMPYSHRHSSRAGIRSASSTRCQNLGISSAIFVTTPR